MRVQTHLPNQALQDAHSPELSSQSSALRQELHPAIQALVSKPWKPSLTVLTSPPWPLWDPQHLQSTLDTCTQPYKTHSLLPT